MGMSTRKIARGRRSSARSRVARATALESNRLKDRPELTPYAPPKADVDAAAPSATIAGAPHLEPAQVATALARLKQHVASPANIAAELKQAGGRLRVVTVVFIALSAVAVLTVGGIAIAVRSDPATAMFGLVPALICAPVAGILVLVDLVSASGMRPRRPTRRSSRT
jgi:hypothetical protein